MKKHALKVVPLDPRTYKLGAVFQLPEVGSIPTEFEIPIQFYKDQGSSDKCAAYASCEVSEDQEGVELNPDYTFAVGKDIENGDVMGFGLSLIDIAKAHCKVGAIEQSQVPKDIDVDDPKYRYIKNWPTDLLPKAFDHKKNSYFQIQKVYGQDWFDSIKSSLYKFRDKKNTVLFGVLWDWPVNRVFIENFSPDGTGHAMKIFGWCTRNGVEYLKAQQSWGKKAGEKSVHYFSREVINKSVDIFGAIMFNDMTRQDIEWYLNNQIKETDNWITVVFKIAKISKVIELLKKLIGVQQELDKIVPPEPEVVIKKDNMLLQKFCLAIQAHEGWVEGEIINEK